MSLQTTTIQVDPNTAIILRPLQQKADLLGETLESLLKPLSVESDEGSVEGLDVSSLKYMPPEDSFAVPMRFVEAGEGEPARFDFSDGG